MFHMMNKERLTGGGAALGHTGYLKSLQYAQDRRCPLRWSDITSGRDKSSRAANGSAA